MLGHYEAVREGAGQTRYEDKTTTTVGQTQVLTNTRSVLCSSWYYYPLNWWDCGYRHIDVWYSKTRNLTRQSVYINIYTCMVDEDHNVTINTVMATDSTICRLIVAGLCAIGKCAHNRSYTFYTCMYVVQYYLLRQIHFACTCTAVCYMIVHVHGNDAMCKPRAYYPVMQSVW